jgi:[NiFe] hydrogenase diaphorase moiety large subunit
MESIDLSPLSAIFSRYSRSATELLQILREVQATYRHVPRTVMAEIACHLDVPVSRVQAVVEFYSFLSSEPLGHFDIRLSDSISDHLLGSRALAASLARHLRVPFGKVRADGRVSLFYSSCTGLCDQGPAALINGRPLTRLDETRVQAIAERIEANTPLDQWPSAWFAVEDFVYTRSLLLEGDLVQGEAIRNAITLGRDAVLLDIESSGLRGRGGAGFKTAAKWRFCYEGPEGSTPGDPAIPRYVVCNADEGEPGTYKDRVILKQKAHEVFEGMTVCARLIGARQGFLYLRGEYAFLREDLEAILASRRASGFLGTSILGEAGFDFDIRIHMGAGAYICGEESALIESLEGKRGNPRNRPPYPVTSGYLGHPTVVNNVETFQAAARITAKGGAWFAAIGTPQSRGTKILSISGDCAKPGIYEVPFGTTVSAILEMAGAPEIIGIQVGGPSGTFISANEVHRKIAFEDLATGGAFMIFAKDRDILAVARNFTRFFAHESCGFCTPCRVGTSLLRNQFEKICEGHGTPKDLVELTGIAQLVRTASHCGLGQTAANPILSTLERFPDRYQERLKALHFEPGFDLDGSLATAREMTGRDDEKAHLHQEG